MISPQIKKKQTKKKSKKIQKAQKTKSRSRKSQNDTRRIVYTLLTENQLIQKEKNYLTPKVK